MNLNKKVGRLTLLNLIFAGAAILFAALYLFMFLGDFAVLGSLSSSGNSLAFEAGEAGVITAWVLGLVGLVAILAGTCLGVLSIKLPKILKPAIFGIGAMLLLVAGILAFCTGAFLSGKYITINLGVAAVFAGIFGILGGVTGCGASFLSLKA